MIPGLHDQIQFKNWQEEIKKGFSTNHALLRFLQLDDEHFELPEKKFPLRVPLAFAKRMEPGNPHDPLLKQVLISMEETLQLTGFTNDPLLEGDSAPVKGLLHKYPGRALLILTNACAIHCRYCFRREFPYQEHAFGKNEWTQALDYLQNNSSIEEIILSGGDPLMLPDKLLLQKMESLSDISHIKTIRLHTRIPIVLPSRVTDSLLRGFEDSPVPITVVVHANHPNELDEAVSFQAKRLKQSGVTLLNQSVLLKDINDDVEILSQLQRDLFAMGVLPYYLHLLDKVTGTHHFEVREDKAIQLIGELRSRLPGYLVPRLVKEIPGESSKVVIAS